VGALYIVPWSRRSRRSRTTREFNHLWVTRFLLQLIAACYALSLCLRLQVGGGVGVAWMDQGVQIRGGAGQGAQHTRKCTRIIACIGCCTVNAHLW
jgi:hypothetical protein